MKTTIRNLETEAARIVVMRRALGRDQTKHSAGGREKRRRRPLPSMPKLKCLDADAVPSGDPDPPPISNPRDRLKWMSASDRTAFKSLSLSPDQVDAIVGDTRLPGEIGYTFGISAALVIRIQATAAKRRRQREKADRSGSEPETNAVKPKRFQGRAGASCGL
jgi:hypothetical protein